MTGRTFDRLALLLLVILVAPACADDLAARRTKPKVTDAGALPESSSADAADSGSTSREAQAPRADAGPVACRNSLDCVDVPDGKNICDPTYRRCVECGSNDDCPTDSECVLNACVAFRRCTNSLNCVAKSVCDTARGRCVDCVTSADCELGFVCSDSFCLLACQSDRQCTPFQLLCDVASGHCVQCTRDADCADSEYCLIGPGSCVADRCTQGSSSCRNGALLRCAENGSEFLAPEACGPAQVCVESATGAACVEQACTGGSCDGGAPP